MKYSGKLHALHLKEALETKYKAIIYWDGNIYVLISLNWEYKKGTVQLDMPGYVRTALH